MPNFWTRTVQKINESLSGPRTNDLELHHKMEKIKEHEKALLKLKKIDEINELYKKTENWDNFYQEIKENFKNVEDSRRVYDHYERKLEILEEKKLELTQHNKLIENSDFFQVLLRNEEKYMKAKEDYITKAIKTFDKSEDLNVKQYNEVNPVLINIAKIEAQIFENFSQNFKAFQNIEEKYEMMTNNFQEKIKNKKNYNPTIFMKNPYLDEKFVIFTQGKFNKLRIILPDNERKKTYSGTSKNNFTFSKINPEKQPNTSKNNNSILINFDDLINTVNQTQRNPVVPVKNDIFSEFNLTSNQDNKQKEAEKELLEDFINIQNKYFQPGKRDSIGSSVSNFSKFPTYKSVVGDNLETHETNNPFEPDSPQRIKNAEELMGALANNNVKKNEEARKEVIDPFEGFY